MKTRQTFWSQPPIMKMIHLETDLFLAMPIVFKVRGRRERYPGTNGYKFWVPVRKKILGTDG